MIICGVFFISFIVKITRLPVPLTVFLLSIF